MRQLHAVALKEVLECLVLGCASMRWPPSMLLVAAIAGCSSGSGAPSTTGPATGGASTCTYPSGRYGTQLGALVDPSLQWQCYVDDGATPTPVAMSDLFDCAGTKGVRVILLQQAATWCGDCVREAQQVGPLAGGKWKDEGVRVVTLVAQDQQEQPATLDTALTWRNEFSLTTGLMCADPAWTMRRWGVPAGGGDNGFPTNVVVDPRTMRIFAIQPDDVPGTVDYLARANE